MFTFEYNNLVILRKYTNGRISRSYERHGISRSYHYKRLIKGLTDAKCTSQPSIDSAINLICNYVFPTENLKHLNYIWLPYGGAKRMKT